MKIALSYDELNAVLNFSSSILSDKIVEDKMKNVIFIVSKDSVKVCFYNALTFCRTELDRVTVENMDEGTSEFMFQVKFQDLSRVISGFSGLSKTTVSNMELEDVKGKIKVVVSEEAIKEEDSRMSQKSVFYLNNVPLLEGISKDLKTEFPEDGDIIPNTHIMLYVDSLLPLLSNDNASAIGSKLNFADDYVFMISSSLSVFFKNKLPDAFRGMTLGYSSVSFLRKLCDAGDLTVKRVDKYLCVSSGHTEAFMRYQPVKIRHQNYVSKYSTENGLLMNRLYMKDVLKRMGMVSPNGTFTVLDNGDLQVENENFNQVIPVEKSKGDMNGVKFKVAVPTIEKIIVGKDTAFPENLFMYVNKMGSGYSLFFSDTSGAWFSMTQVQ